MGKVIEFHSKSEQESKAMESAFFESLTERGYDESCANIATQEAMFHYEKAKRIFSTGLSFSFESELPDEDIEKLTGAFSKAFKAYQADVSDLINSLIISLSIARAESKPK